MKKIVATYLWFSLNYLDDILQKAGAEFVLIPCKSNKEIIAASQDADAIATVITFQPFSKELIQKLGFKVRHISSAGIGYEGIDLTAATKRGIVVTNTPLYCLDEVSDHTMALVLALNRKLPQLDKAARNFNWRINSPEVYSQILPPMKKLRGQILGLIGFGNVARAVVQKAKGFGLEVIACDPNVSEEVMRAHFGVRKVDLFELLRESDFVSLHVSLSEKTRRLLEGEHFRSMKPTAYFINTARGGLVDEDALIKALQKKWIAGAGLDVISQEPPKENNPLLKMENVIISGHSAQYSDESEIGLLRIPIEEAILSVQGKFPRFAVNQEIQEKWLKKWSD